jgi:hypothetical protein
MGVARRSDKTGRVSQGHRPVDSQLVMLTFVTLHYLVS